MANKKKDVDAWTAEQVRRAAYFTACQKIGPGKFDRREAATLGEAKAIGLSMGHAMLYAVTPEGYTVPLFNVRA